MVVLLMKFSPRRVAFFLHSGKTIHDLHNYTRHLHVLWREAAAGGQELPLALVSAYARAALGGGKWRLLQVITCINAVSPAA